ncbi:MAG: PilX N-terminal domain-containing pilus assembly protein [Methylococcaceae bacterium]
MKSLLSIQRGFSLMSAIFLLVVISALGLFAVTVSTSQQQNAANDVLGSRAYQAAKAGLEAAVYQLSKGGATCATLVTPVMPSGQLSGFTITLTCNSTAYTDGTTGFVYQVTSTAKTTGGVVASPYYVERQVSMMLAL